MLPAFQEAKPVYSFPEFLQYCEDLVAAGRTSGPEQSEFLIHFTKLNYQRMVRWTRIVVLSPETVAAALQARSQVWYVITEAWCGDSAQNLPVLAKIAEASEGRIDLHVVLRDVHPELIDAYLTQGTRSIPKLVAFDRQDGKELFTWGPRPQGADKLFRSWKTNPDGRDFEAFEKELHTWYARDKGQEVQEELREHLAATSG